MFTEPEPPAKKAKNVGSKHSSKDDKTAEAEHQVKKENSMDPNASSCSKIEDSSSKEEAMEMDREDNNMSTPGLRSSRRCKAKSMQHDLSQEEETDSASKDGSAIEAESNEERDKQEEDSEVEGDKKEEMEEEEVEDFVPPDAEGAWSIKVTHEIELAALEEVEALEERIFQASLQAKVRLR